MKKVFFITIHAIAFVLSHFKDSIGACFRNRYASKQVHGQPTGQHKAWLSPLILSCFFLSGVAGLIYEVLWVRMIDKVIGSAPFAVATVLAVFMGGLALGSYLAGTYIDRVRSKGNLLLVYGAAEVVIGMYGLLLPLLITMVKPIYVVAYNSLFQYFWAYQAFTFLGCSLLLIVPTTLMGVTLPVLCRFYVTHLDHVGARTGRLYGINTVGAAVGALLCGFFLINAIGVWGSLFVAGAVNLLVGFLCILLGRGWLALGLQAWEQHRVSPEKPKPSVAEKPRDPMATWALCIFALSGFSSMAYEVIWTRLLALIIGPTTYSFTLVIATFIIGLALGSILFGWLGDRVKALLPLLAGTQLAAACLALLVSQFFGNSQFFFTKLIYTFEDHFEAMMLVQFMVVFFILLAPTVLLGATFPLVNRIYARSLPVIGKSIGTAYALNTIGAILGSLVAGFMLIPFLGKEGGLRLVMVLQFGLALTALVSLGARTKKRPRHWLLLSATAVVGLVLFLHVPSWNRQLLSLGRYRDYEDAETYLAATSWLQALYRGPKVLLEHEAMPEIVFYGDGIGGFTTVEKVTDELGTDQYALRNSGKPDASSHGDRATQTLLAHIPLLFHPDPERVMVLGLASGMTAGEVLHYPVRQLDVLEINDQAVKASGFFTPWNNACLTDPRTRLIVQDGRNHLALTRERYDVISSEPSNPWMAGLANLFTLEFFETVRDRLREHGIFVQWIHSYEMDWSTFALAGRTFAKVFPHSLLMTTMPWEPGDYLLVGFSGQRVPSLDVARKNMKYAQRSRNISLTEPRLLFHLIITEDLNGFFGPGPLHTDNWPRLEFAAPKQLHLVDLSIEKAMTEGRWLSPQTRSIIDAGNPMDTLLDLVEFSATSYSDDPPFGVIDLDDATPSQKERYLSIVKRYCSQTFVDDYEIFQSHEVKEGCATIQAVKLGRHIALNPDDAKAYSGLGFALLAMGKVDEAIQALQRAASLSPFDFAARNNLGAAFARLGRYEEAIAHFSEAVRIKPKEAEVRYNLGAALVRLGRYEEAVSHLSEALRINPHDAGAHHNLGVALTNLERYEEAIAHFSEALHMNPDDAEIHNNLGAALALHGKLKEAIAHFSEAVRINPDFTEAHNKLELVLKLMGKSGGTPNNLKRP
ncbi:MAG: fused MFS/spermidine synthase [Deltaproteobacteria bacterium]|nr:MAG: fused MFS/spermidine synthase [Deltaproteobacteria bacterium]